MKLAIISDELSQDLELVVNTAVNLDFGGIEIRSFDGLAPGAQSQDDLNRARTIITKAGLSIAGYCPPALKQPIPSTRTGLLDARNQLTADAERASWLAAPHLRIFSFYRDGKPDPIAAAKAFCAIVDDMTRPLPPLLLETGTRTNTPSIDYALEFLSIATSKVDGLLWDPGNSVFAGYLSGAVEDEWIKGRDLIKHVHVKDPDGANGYVRLGDGTIPWPALLRRMSGDHYGGWLSLETHWRPEQQLAASLRDVPHGHAFSAGGFSASVECMQILHNWAATL